MNSMSGSEVMSRKCRTLAMGHIDISLVTFVVVEDFPFPEHEVAASKPASHFSKFLLERSTDAMAALHWCILKAEIPCQTPIALPVFVSQEWTGRIPDALDVPVCKLD